MMIQPPIAVIVRVPDLTFNLSDFQRAYPVEHSKTDTKIEFIGGGSSIVRDFSLDDLDEAMRQASPPATLTIPTEVHL